MKTIQYHLNAVKHMGMMFILLCGVTTLIFITFFCQERKHRFSIHESAEKRNILLLQKVIENEFEENAYNLIFLANHTALHRWLNTGSPADRAAVTDLFKKLCKESGKYDQIRFLDRSGMEAIRVNYKNGTPEAVLGDQLQDKSKRYYFPEAIQLERNRIFVSPFDLNIENGEIERPFKPMIRFAMPVYNARGDIAGIILFNYLGNHLIKTLDAISDSTAGNIILLNSGGYWLKGLTPEQEWGFMFPHLKNERFALKHPAAWNEINRQDQGQFISDQAFISYATVRFTDLGLFSPDGYGHAFNPCGHVNGSYYLKVASVMSPDAFNQISYETLRDFIPYSIPVLLILLFISLGFGISINFRKKALKAIDKNEAELRSLFRSVPAGIGVVQDRIIMQANEQLCRMTGYTKEELISQNARILYPTREEFEYVGDEKYRQIRENGTGSVETRWKRKDGTMINVLLSSTPIKLNDLAYGVTFSAFDITDRTQAEEKLALSEYRHRFIVESAGDGIFTTSKQGRITSLNAAMESIIGQDRTDWLKKPFIDLISDRDKTAVKQGFQKILNGRPSLTQEIRVRPRQTETCKICECKLIPKINADSRVIGVVGFVKDITEYKMAQERAQRFETQLRHAQKMEAIGTLAGGIAHDFNNILSAIFGYAQLAERGVDDISLTKKSIAQIIKGAQRASDLVQQILTFSRQTESEKLPITLSVTMKEALKLLRASIPSTIEFKLDIDSRAKVMADPTQVHQVVMNLCTNGYHAMKDTGGTLDVSLREIDVPDTRDTHRLNRRPGPHLLLEVRDTGTGIAPDVRDRIFDPYFTTKSIGEGTGFGLALVQAIVNDHNGFLELDTAVGSGTSFKIYFPIMEDKKMSLPAPEPKPTDNTTHDHHHIMLVDDEKCIRKAYKGLLENYGFTVTAFTNGNEALAAFISQPDTYSLVLTDMTMPGMSGDRLAKEILERFPDTPIVLCTGFSENITNETVHRLGIKKLLQKPVSVSEMVGVIRELL